MALQRNVLPHLQGETGSGRCISTLKMEATFSPKTSNQRNYTTWNKNPKANIFSLNQLYRWA